MPSKWQWAVVVLVSAVLFGGSAIAQTLQMPFRFEDNRGQHTSGTAYTMQFQDANTSRASTETAVLTSTGSYAGRFNLSSNTNWSAVVATFKAAGSGPAPDFTLSATPAAQTITQGGDTTFTVTVTPQNEFAGTVNVGVTGFGSGAGGGCYPMSITGSGSCTLRISSNPVAQTGTFTVTITGTSAFLSHSTTVTLTVNPRWSGGITLVQSNADNGTGVLSVSVPFALANTAGNLIIAAVRLSTASQTASVSDTAGNAYAMAASTAQSTDGHQLSIFYANNIVAGPNTVTASFSGTNDHAWLSIFEYSGLDPANPLDGAAAAQNIGTAVDSGPTSVTSVPNELVFGAVGLPSGYSGEVTPGTGFSPLQQDAGPRAVVEGMTVSSTGSYDAVFNLSPGAAWTAAVATFKAAGSRPAADFGLSVSPSSRTVPQGSSTAYTVSVMPLNGFSGTVGFAVSGYGSGANLSFNPPTVTGAGSMTLTVSTTSSAQTGSFTLLITGGSDSLVHTASTTLIVNPSGGGMIP